MQNYPNIDDSQDEDVFETASATTSPDNSNSGPFAYIVAGVVLFLTLVSALIGGGCTSMILLAAGDELAQESHGHSLSSPGGMGSLRDFEDWLEQEYQTDDDPWPLGESHQDDDTASTSLEDALNFDLALYGVTIDDEVSASSYAGVPDEVRTFVRDLLAKDNDFAGQVSQLLNSAALNEGQRVAKIDDAYDLCASARDAIASLQIPAIAADKDGEVKDALGTAKSHAEQRYEYMAAELDVLRSDRIGTKRLWNADDDVLDATEEAAEELMEAMAEAARL